MNTVGHLVGILGELRIRRSAAQRREALSLEHMHQALKAGEAARAREQFDVALEWNALGHFVDEWATSLRSQEISTYLVDAWFLRDLIAHLTKGKDEEISYVTGAQIGSVKVLSRICRVALAKQSEVYALGTAKSCSDALIDIHENGNALHVMAHSHPGSGPAATRESAIDIAYLGRIQRTGADVIGIIACRCGHVRFFTVEKPFRIITQGAGITEVEQHVYRVVLA